MAAIARDFGLGGSALPRLSLLVYRIADGVTAGWGPALCVYLIAVVAAIWYFLGLAWPGHGPRRTPRFLPGLAGVTANHDAARLCAVWSVLARRGVPLDRIIETVAEMMEDHTVAADLRRLGALAAAGTPLAKGLESVHAVPESVAMVLTYAPEPDVAARLVSLKQLYIEAMSLAARRAMVLWHTLTFFGMALVAGGVVLALFLPLIHLIRCLAG
jgi:type II secretory pathway component PulF